MDLSKNFTLEELTVTHSKLPNKPTNPQIANLTALVQNVLQPLRDMLGKPIKVNSGFRSPDVNKAIGGAANSQHCTGEAADIESTNNAELFDFIHTHFTFDQLIWEGGNSLQPDWVHVSYKAANNRKQTLKMVVQNGKKTYMEIT